MIEEEEKEKEKEEKEEPEEFEDNCTKDNITLVDYGSLKVDFNTMGH